MVDVHLQTLPSCRRMTTNHPVFPFPVKETDALPLIQRDKTKWPFTSSVISWQHCFFAHCLWVWIKKLTPTFTCAFLDIKGEYNIIHFFFKMLCLTQHCIAGLWGSFQAASLRREVLSLTHPTDCHRKEIKRKTSVEWMQGHVLLTLLSWALMDAYRTVPLNPAEFLALEKNK